MLRGSVVHGLSVRAIRGLYSSVAHGLVNPECSCSSGLPEFNAVSNFVINAIKTGEDVGRTIQLGTIFLMFDA